MTAEEREQLARLASRVEVLEAAVAALQAVDLTVVPGEMTQTDPVAEAFDAYREQARKRGVA